VPLHFRLNFALKRALLMSPLSAAIMNHLYENIEVSRVCILFFSFVSPKLHICKSATFYENNTSELEFLFFLFLVSLKLHVRESAAFVKSLSAHASGILSPGYMTAICPGFHDLWLL
jgi:hypothetical protein